MVETALQYLSRNELYATEKPYSVEFEVDGNLDSVQKTNYIISEVPANIREITPSDNFTLETNGFCVLNEITHVDAAKAVSDASGIEAAYLSELEAILHRRFPEYQRLEPLEFVVRKRHEKFPSSEKALVSHEQPACIPHSDYSIQGAILQLKSIFPGQEKHFENKEYDMINVWRPLIGPNDDWPLALCDYTSINPEKDIVAADRVHADRIGENQLLFPSPEHRWYYISGQQPYNLLVFRNIDSTGERATSFHASFRNPLATGPPRQSCEVRFVAFR